MTTNTAAPSTWLGIAQVHEEYGFPEATLYGWRHKGIGPPSVRAGRRVMYRRSDIEAWLDGLAEAERARRDRV